MPPWLPNGGRCGLVKPIWQPLVTGAAKFKGGLWLLNDLSDSAGNNPRFTYNGTVTRRSGPFLQRALTFDGTSGYLDVPLCPSNFLSATAANPLTIWAWVNPTAAASGIILSKANNVPNTGFNFGIGTNPCFGAVASSNMRVDSTSTVTVGVWTHLAVTWDGNTAGTGVTFYINGVATGDTIVAAGGTQNGSDTFDLLIGHTLGAGTSVQANCQSFFNGAIDHIGFDRRAYTAPEIARLYNDPFWMLDAEVDPTFHAGSLPTQAASTWGWATQEPQGTTPRRPLPRAGSMKLRGDDGSQAALINWFNAGWEIQPPPPRRPTPRAGSMRLRGDDGSQRPFVQWYNSGWEIQSHQPRKPTPRSEPHGDEGIQSPYVMWRNAGWEPQFQQPPHPRREKAGFLLSGVNIENPFVVVTPPAWGWEVLPPSLRWMISRSPGIDGLSMFAAFDMQPLNWETMPWQPAYRRNRQVTGPENIPSVFVFTPGTQVAWGWDPTVAQPPHRFNRIPALLRGDDGNESPFNPWYNFGWEFQPSQPPHPRPERAASFLFGDTGTQAPFIPTFAPVAWGWESVLNPAYRYRWERGAAGMRGDEGIQTQFVNWQNYGWEIQSHQPQHPRPERAASWLFGDTGTEAPFVPTFVLTDWGWEVIPAVAHHIRWARGAVGMRGDEGTQGPYVFWYNGGWWIAPFQPGHPRPERAGAIMFGDTGIEGTFTPPIPVPLVALGWEVPTSLIAYHVPRQRAGAVFVGDQGNQAPYVPPPVGRNFEWLIRARRRARR